MKYDNALLEQLLTLLRESDEAKKEGVVQKGIENGVRIRNLVLKILEPFKGPPGSNTVIATNTLAQGVLKAPTEYSAGVLTAAIISASYERGATAAVEEIQRASTQQESLLKHHKT